MNYNFGGSRIAPQQARSKFMLVVSLWVEPDKVDPFGEYERRAASVIAGFGGEIERVIRRAGDDPQAPFETHIVSFPSADAYEQYRASPAVLALAAERAQVIARTEVWFGYERPSYMPGGSSGR
jgi:uncharacterized protein (DUF1330 family)